MRFCAHTKHPDICHIAAPTTTAAATTKSSKHSLGNKLLFEDKNKTDETNQTITQSHQKNPKHTNRFEFGHQGV